MGPGRTPPLSAGAVFLSYASQDAEAAERITEALRAAGLEVWFDQSELRGGDAWDQEIRRQIRDSALFMPLVSANTNARAEGYFRLEWKLAVDRSHLMADDAPFIFPVAIDGSTEAGSRVPDRFRELQWMRLGKDAPEKIAARAAKLLSGEAKPAARAIEPLRRRIRSRHVWPFVGIAIALFFITMPQWRAPKRVAAPISAAMPAQEAAGLAQRAIDLTTKLNFTRQDLALGASLAGKASELDPSLAAAWGARARVEAAWIFRNWDRGEARRRAAEESARRAVVLDSEEPNALWSLAVVLQSQQALGEAADLFRRAIEAAPRDNYHRRGLAQTLFLQGRAGESQQVLEEALRSDSRDPLNHVTMAMSYASSTTVKDNKPESVDVALRHIDRALEIQPFGNALTWRAAFLAAWKGDFPGADAALAQLAKLSHDEATEDRAVFFRMWIALLEGQPERALAAAALTTSTYFTDSLVEAPVGWMKGFAHREAGRPNAAAEEWRAAEGLLRSRLAANPDSLATQAELAITHALLGRRADARKQFTRYDAAMRDQGRHNSLRHVRYYAAMGDGKRVAEAVREIRKTRLPLWITDVALARDPWFGGVRDKPEFQALLRPRGKVE